MVNVGDRAPDFELKDHNNKPVKLSSFRGKNVLLAFFPFAFSPVCTSEMSCFDTDIKDFRLRGVNILGVSVDSHWANKAFVDSLGIGFPLLSDFDKKVCREYGVLRQEGFANRAYFLIDEKGSVKYKHVMPEPGTKLENEQLLEALGSIGIKSLFTSK